MTKTTKKKTTRKAPSAKVNKDQDQALALLLTAAGQLCQAMNTQGGARTGYVSAAKENIADAEQLIVLTE